MMALPNLVCLLAMTGVVVAETRAHLWEAGADGPLSRGAAEKRSA
jgi:hypothetical protein